TTTTTTTVVVSRFLPPHGEERVLLRGDRRGGRPFSRAHFSPPLPRCRVVARNVCARRTIHDASESPTTRACRSTALPRGESCAPDFFFQMFFFSKVFRISLFQIQTV